MKPRVQRAFTRAGFDRDNIIAVVMAAIATFAAITSFQASSLEFSASACDRALTQAQHFELARRQSYVERYYQHLRLSSSDDIYKALADVDNRQTSAIARVDAQIDLAIARFNRGVEEFLDPQLSKRPTL